MTESDWNSSTDPQKMLVFLRDSGRASERKLRLFACACVRRIWHLLPDERSRQAVATSEQYADGRARRTAMVEDRKRALVNVVSSTTTPAAYAATSAARPRLAPAWVALLAQDAMGSAGGSAAERGVQAALLRDVLGNPFRTVTVALSLLEWNEGTVVRLANASYDDRILPSGQLGPAGLAVLADALEDAGCTDSDVLAHLRGEGPHVRGCWAVDAVLQLE